ncbi:MAG: DUF561 domain-containing protein [Melioribacteraceae bacterium]
MTNNKITKLFNIELSIIQGGMVWVSGWKLASAVSSNGGLGLIGSGSMTSEVLREHIIKCKKNTSKSFGVNVPLLREDVEELIKVIIEENVKIVFTSAGHPGKHIDLLKSNNIKVVHVVPNLIFALKAESVGCDAIVAEGVEAGGHNGIDEITTFSLIPQLVDELKIPIIAAGGISDGRGILAAFSLGAEGVQIGTRFAVTQESSAHINYKKAVVEAKGKDTQLILKKLGMARVIRNKFSKEAVERELNCDSLDELKKFLNSNRERKGIFEGDLTEGMIEASQSSAIIKDIPTVSEVMQRFISEYNFRKTCL